MTRIVYSFEEVGKGTALVLSRRKNTHTLTRLAYNYAKQAVIRTKFSNGTCTTAFSPSKRLGFTAIPIGKICTTALGNGSTLGGLYNAKPLEAFPNRAAQPANTPSNSIPDGQMRKSSIAPPATRIDVKALHLSTLGPQAEEMTFRASISPPAQQLSQGTLPQAARRWAG
ncbi:hypothetical protein WJX73_003609 [Symbiochloris irregularis]|uniref:Uncharacterized protein n=1 Tax=Symbiochloris irregularis TaxID=706552 RepID=A0AAW1PE59_9CHLO